MNHRERFQAALDHREPDRVPLDIGGSIVTSIAASAYERLRPALGFSLQPPRIASLYSQTAQMDEDVLVKLGVDTRPTTLQGPAGFEQKISTVDGHHVFTDEWGITCSMSIGGNSGYTVIKHPLMQATCVADIEKFAWPNGADPGRFVGVEEHVRRLANEQKVGIILETSIGGVYEWPAWLRGSENFLMDLGGDELMAQAVMEKIVEFKIAYWEALLGRVGQYVGLVRESDDLAGQSGLLISRAMYRKYFKPLHTRICAAIRKHTNAAICLHSCGAVYDLIPDLLEAGFTALNPVQVGAAQMDPIVLKREFGKDLVFWGGAIDSQQLPHLTPEEVKYQARKNLEALAPGGGYIFAPINMIQADVPAANIIAMVETLHEFGEY